MPFSLPRFIRATSSGSLRAYLESREAAPPEGFEWDVRPRDFVASLASHLLHLDETEQAKIYSDLDRVHRMADDVGERCFLDSADARRELIESFERFDSATDRALHVLLAHPALFERAELLRYVEANRQARHWEGFVVPVGIKVRRDEDGQAELKKAVQEHFRERDGTGRRLVIEIFDRIRTEHDRITDLVQVMVYLEGLPASGLVFNKDDLERQTYRPAVEVAWTYEPETGELEVLARGGRPVRAELARQFVTHLLGSDGNPETIALKRYELDSLRRPRSFPTDPEDHIAKVRIRRLRLRPFGPAAGALTLERDARGSADLHALSSSWFGNSDPLRGGFRVNQATISIEFEPAGDRKRGRVVTFDLSRPNGSTLKNHTNEHRIIGEKYLARWGLLQTL